MSFYEKGAVRIYYEESGSGFPLLIIPGGGLNSTIAGLKGSSSPFNPMEEFKGEYRCIAADLRNADGGQSIGPLEIDRPWDAFADDQLGVQGKGTRNSDSLPLAAAELMGIALGMLGIESHLLQKIRDPLLSLLLRPDVEDLQGLPDNPLHGLSGIKRRIGVLKDDLHIPPERPHLLAAQFADVGTLEEDLSS